MTSRRASVVVAAAGLALAAPACASFESPEVVVDLRVLAITSEPPEQVVDLDVTAPPTPAEVQAQLVPIEVCALIADPGATRGLLYELDVCVDDDDGRCVPDTAVAIARGSLGDPETAAAPRACATVQPDGNFLGILLQTLERDQVAGLGGIDALLQLRVRGEDEPAAAWQYAARSLRVAPRLPATRQPNTSPRLDALTVVPRATPDAAPVPLPPGRCADQPAPYEVAAGARLRLTPVEPEGVRETYGLPTLDGQVQEFTESLTYQWVATAGNFSAGSTGGPRDGLGNYPELFTDWRAPAAADLAGPTDVQLWVIQRDERLGLTPHLGCVRVIP